MDRRRVSLPTPFDFAATVGSLMRRRDLSMRVTAREAWRATRTPLGPATLYLQRDGDHLDARAWGPGAPYVLEHVEDLIGAHDDPTPFDPHDALLKDLHRRNRGLRLGRTLAVVEA